jgi:hypothetical protein
MIITHYLLALFLALTGLLIFSYRKDTATGTTVLKGAATGNVWGEIEPCG